LGLGGAATTMAQVYSVNAVGYVNTTLKGAAFSLISNPLDAGAGNNTVEKLFVGMDDGSTIYQWTGKTYIINDYTFGTWAAPTMEVAPGGGVFVYNAGADKTITFVGEVMQGTGANALKNEVPVGFSIESSMVPQAGKLQTDLKFPIVNDDTIYTYVNGKYVISSFSFDAWDPSEPVIGVGEAFWSYKNTATTWTRDFSVNQ